MGFHATHCFTSRSIREMKVEQSHIDTGVTNVFHVRQGADCGDEVQSRGGFDGLHESLTVEGMVLDHCDTDGGYGWNRQLPGHDRLRYAL